MNKENGESSDSQFEEDSTNNDNDQTFMVDEYEDSKLPPFSSIGKYENIEEMANESYQQAQDFEAPDYGASTSMATTTGSAANVAPAQVTATTTGSSTSTGSNADKKQKKTTTTKHLATSTKCRGNAIRVCHKNEAIGKTGDARRRCTVCCKKTSYYCLDCRNWLCLCTKNTIAGENKFLKFYLGGATRRKPKDDSQQDNHQRRNNDVEIICGYRSCWQIYHEAALNDYSKSD